MKKFFYLMPLLAMLVLSCDVQEEEKYVEYSDVRVTLSPAPEEFNADGTTVSGNSSYKATVVVSAGTSIADLDWKAEFASETAWAKVKQINIQSKVEVQGEEYSTEGKGIEVTVEPNDGWKRSCVLNITVSDGTVVPFTFSQLGSKADAAVTASVESVEFSYGGGTVEVEYTTNMDDVYSYEIEYAEGSSDWLTVEDKGTGKLALLATEWDNSNMGREAKLTITVGSETTSIATADVIVRQLAKDKYYFMYGASADDRTIDKAIQLEKVEAGVYTVNAYIMKSEDGKNPVMFNVGGRVLEYPYYALAADGTVAEIKEGASVPQGPEIDIDGMRKLVVDFNALTWTINRISTPNCMPDSEVANYKTKEYIARDGSKKTWMIEHMRWDGGDITPKLGSPMVPSATGNGTGGYSTYPTAWNAGVNPDYETTEIGGKLEGTSEFGRLYAFEEMMNGVPRAGLGYARREKVPENWWPGVTFVDAVGKEITIAEVTASTFSGDNAKDEADYPVLVMQVQGICPYGWHVANSSDWLDLAYAASQASAGDKYPVAESDVNYKNFTNTSSGIPNFGAWLRNSTDWIEASLKADGADEFGFNYYPLGFRYMANGFRKYKAEAQPWLPLFFENKNYPQTSPGRIRTILNSNATNNNWTAGISVDNGNAILNFRCVKNSK